MQNNVIIITLKKGETVKFIPDLRLHGPYKR